MISSAHLRVLRARMGRACTRRWAGGIELAPIRGKIERLGTRTGESWKEPFNKQ